MTQLREAFFNANHGFIMRRPCGSPLFCFDFCLHFSSSLHAQPSLSMGPIFNCKQNHSPNIYNATHEQNLPLTWTEYFSKQAGKINKKKMATYLDIATVAGFFCSLFWS